MRIESRKVNLTNPHITIRHKLAGLWIAAMFCYIYADILAFYDAYLVGEIIKGNMGPWPITQELKFGIGVFMSVPAIMVYVSLAVSPKICRIANVLAAILFTIVSIATTVMSVYFYYIYFGILEIAITTYVIWMAWRWPSDKSVSA